MRVYDVGGDGRNVTVLIADDNDVAQRLCRRVLEKAGYKVLLASDGLEAVSLALAHSPDMILMDIAMPVMDGLEAMRQIKQQKPGIAIVIASAIVVAADREWLLAAGADDVWIKPFRLIDLVAVVAKFTANRGLQMKDLTGARRGSGEIVQRLGGGGIGDVPTQPSPAAVSAPLPEQTRDLDRLAADLEAVWNQVESGQLALGEPNEDLHSLFETLIAGLRASRAGNGSGPSPHMRALRRAKHRPVIQTLLRPKYEDDEGLAVAAWDGMVRLGCRCGWRDSRIETASTAPASIGSLSDAWREHVMADMAGVEHWRGHTPDSGPNRPSA